jgi:hypothetical protein
MGHDATRSNFIEGDRHAESSLLIQLRVRLAGQAIRTVVTFLDTDWTDGAETAWITASGDATILVEPNPLFLRVFALLCG